MDAYIISLVVIGIVALSISWVKYLTGLIGISYPIIFMAWGALMFSLIPELPYPSPYRDQKLTMHLAEIMVIISLMGTGLRIDNAFNIKRWAVPIRLVVITMILSIGAMVALGYWALGWGLASAVLLGAVLAPTDPVLAGDVQVGPPNSGESNEAKFSLTAEAGLNDGLAFPFVWLAILLAHNAAGGAGFSWTEWVAYDVIYRIAAGVFIGFAVGKLVVFLFFTLPDKYAWIDVRRGLIALSATFLVYGVTELAHGYGFIAVFVSAVTIRNHDIEHEYHTALHQFIDQVEHIMLAILLVLFGGSLVHGILDHLTWTMAAIALIFLCIIRPVAAYLSLWGSKTPEVEKWTIGFFGIRGIGSFFYLAFALTEARFPFHPQLWSIVAFIVLVSIVGHGLTATTVMKQLEKRSG